MLRGFMTGGLAAVTLALTVAAPALAEPTNRDPAKAPAGTYELDPRHAGLVVKIAHLGGFSRYTMRFNALTGGFTYDPANWQATKATITVDPKSIDTHDSAFDKQIAGYFEADKFPAITFVSTAVQGGADGKGTMTGDLTFHGVTKPVTFEITFGGAGHGVTPLGTRLGLSGATQIKRSDFGISNFVLNQFTGDEVDVAFEVEFEKK